MAPTVSVAPSASAVRAAVATPRKLRANRPSHGHGCSCSGCSARRSVRAQAAADAPPDSNVELKYFSQRMSDITKHFPSAINMDDFLARVEVALCAHGFRGDNSITCTNLCRDESTGILKTEIDDIFGASFNINGLGACLTCGQLGFRAGFSHAPTHDGKERYVFFSFPHIAIDSEGKVGAISRPGRAGPSSACGALIGALGQFQGDPSVMDAYAEGKHDPFDPEFAILKQRLAERMKKEQLQPKDMDLVSITQLAERTITSDLEALIKETVDPNVSDYAVVTGIHVHNWGNEGTGAPTLEWIAPANMYIVNDGKRTTINLEAVPALTPRQLAILQHPGMPDSVAAAFAGSTTVVESKLTDPAAGPVRAA